MKGIQGEPAIVFCGVISHFISGKAVGEFVHGKSYYKPGYAEKQPKKKTPGVSEQRSKHLKSPYLHNVILYNVLISFSFNHYLAFAVLYGNKSRAGESVIV